MNIENLKPNDQRAKNAITLIWTVLVLEIVSATSGYFQYELLQTVIKGGDITEGAAQANDIREQVIGIVYLIVFIISTVTFIQWFRRAYFNLHQCVDHLAHSEGWAAGSWFVPIVSLFRPYQIMKELYTETISLLSGKNLLHDFQRISAGSLGLWWTLWIIDSFVGQFVFRVSMKAESLDELSSSTMAGIISNLIGIPLALMTVKVIKDYAAVEPLLFEIRDEETILMPLAGHEGEPLNPGSPDEDKPSEQNPDGYE